MLDPKQSTSERGNASCSESMAGSSPEVVAPLGAAVRFIHHHPCQLACLLMTSSLSFRFVHADNQSAVAVQLRLLLHAMMASRNPSANSPSTHGQALSRA